MDWKGVAGIVAILWLGAFAFALFLIEMMFDIADKRESAPATEPEPVWVIHTPVPPMPGAPPTPAVVVDVTPQSQPTYCPACRCVQSEYFEVSVRPTGEMQVCRHHLRALQEVYADEAERAAVIDNLMDHATK